MMRLNSPTAGPSPISTTIRLALLALAGFSLLTAILLAPADADGKRSKRGKARASATTSVTITEPAEGATISGSVVVRASASSPRALRSVRFYVDGALRSTDKRAPFSYTLDTKQLVNGAHKLRAVLTVSGGRTAADDANVSVLNLAPEPPAPVPEPEPTPEPTPPTSEPTPPTSEPTPPTSEPTPPTSEPTPPVTEPTPPVTEPTPPVTEPTPTTPKPLGVTGTWNQIWGDEFNGTTLDVSKWASLRGPLEWEYGNPFNPSLEDAYYKKNNVSVSGGNLVMTLKKEATSGYPYSSGMVHSGRNFGFRYGYIEARTYVPKCDGCWPAFWMLDLPLDDHWPPEIDIFEYFGSLDDPSAYFNYHYEQSGAKQIGVKPYTGWGADNTGWHTFGLKWTSDKLQTYIDGQPGPSYTNATLVTKVQNYILFNFALQKGGTAPTGQQFLVDYVRVWQGG